MGEAMPIFPILKIYIDSLGSKYIDASKRLISCHAEMTANNIKDPGKYDLVLSNVGGVFYGAFAPNVTSMVWGQDQIELYPKRRVILQVNNQKRNCKTQQDNIITIFSGDIQKAEVDEMYCRIEGSCSQGGWVSGLVEDEDWFGYTNSQIVNTLLDRFGFTNSRHIHIPGDMNIPPMKNPNANLVNLDLDTALNIVAQWSQCIYFLDEQDELWFIPPTTMRNAVSNLNGKVIRGTMARNGVGYANAVTVFGGAYPDHPYEDGTEPPSHEVIVAHAKADQTLIDQYGMVAAPALYYPDASPEEVKRVAKNLIAWYDQNRDVPQVKVVGVAPGIWTLVQYSPWNDRPPRINCPGDDYIHISGPTTGLISRRVVDISVENGFTCQLEICRNFQEAGTFGWGGVYPADDPGVNPYPGVTIIGDTALLDPSIYDGALQGAGDGAEGDVLVFDPATGEMRYVSPMDRRTNYNPGNGWYIPIRRGGY